MCVCVCVCVCVCLNYGIKEVIKSSVFNASFSERNRIKNLAPIRIEA